MNKIELSRRLPHSDQTLVLDALAALQRKAPITGKLVESEAASHGAVDADATIDLMYEHTQSRYIVECKLSLDRKAQIDQVSRKLKAIQSQGLMIAPYVSKELAEHCQAIGLQFIDTCGNAFLRGPGLYVIVTGEKGERGQQFMRPTKGLTSATGLRVVFALLSKPELLNGTFQEVARHAGVAMGTAHNAMADLARRGYMTGRGSSGRRTLLERRRLLDEWAINYPTTLHPKLHGRRFSAPDRAWWQNVDAAELQSAWGSEVAAAKMTGHLKPATQTLYVPPTDMDSVIMVLAKQHRIRPHPDGEIEILQKFWHWQPETMPDIAPEVLVYSELLALLDPRAQETADIIREQFIEPTFNPE